MIMKISERTLEEEENIEVALMTARGIIALNKENLRLRRALKLSEEMNEFYKQSQDRGQKEAKKTAGEIFKALIDNTKK